MRRLLAKLGRPPATSNRRLIVGLGNPGPSYRETRHNVGFQVIDHLLSRTSVASSRNKFDAETFHINREGDPAWVLLKPQTYMNCSGRSVAACVRFYQLPLEHLLVVCDDFNLPLGRLRFRSEGSHGGQKGLADIIERLGTNAFPRLRIGIAAPAGAPIEHVLGTFAPDERPVINDAVRLAAEGVEYWAEEGLEAAMNRYNGG